MKLIIDIPEEVYKRTIFYKEFHTLNDCVETIKALEKGIQLPKGHGRLIDADVLKEDAQTMTEWNGDVFRCVTERTIDYAPTVVEADKEMAE